MPTTPPPVTPGSTGSSTGSGSSSYNQGNAYDPRIGAGALPQYFWGSQNKAYVRNTSPGELTSNNLNGLLDQNSQYMQNARRTGFEQAAARGSLNGSISAGASQREAIAAGMPIAQADAQANMATAEQNQQWLNQRAMNSENADASMRSSMYGANASREASMYGDDIGLQRQRENLAYTGEQAGLDRSFTDYMGTRGYQNNLGLQQAQFGNNMALQQGQYDLGYRNQMGQNQFNLGANMLQANQNFSHNFALQAMNNPAIMSDPASMGGYMNFINNDYSGYIDNIFNNLYGGY